MGLIAIVENMEKIYLSPEVEVVLVNVEMGFAGSDVDRPGADLEGGEAE